MCCPKCNYYFLVSGNCINDYYKCNKCGFELSSIVKKNAEDYKQFMKTLSKVQELASKKEIDKELNILLDLYNKKAIV